MHFMHFSSIFTKSPLYICREFSRNRPFYAKQTQFPKKSNDVSFFYTMDYENISDWTLGENKPNSNPNKPNLQKAKMNVNLYVIEDYRKKDDFIVRINKPNLVRRRRIPKMNANLYVIEDYENEPPSGPKKQTQNKPNLVRRRRIANQLKITCRTIRPNPRQGLDLFSS